MKKSQKDAIKVEAATAPASCATKRSALQRPKKAMMLSVGLPLTFIAAAVSMSAQAQTENAGRFELSPFAGYHMFQSKQNLEDAFTYGLRLGYGLTPHWSIEGAVSFVGSEVDDTTLTATRSGQFSSPAGDVDLTLYQLDALYHFRPHSQFSPYVVLGYGATDYSPSLSDKDMSTFNLGVGAKYWMSDNLAMRFDLRDHYVGEVFDNSYHNLSATLGITFAFGGKSRSASPVVEEARPAPRPVAAEPKPEPVIVLEFEDIHFNFDESTLSNDAKAKLQRSVKRLQENPKSKVRIAGYTSASGTAEHNQGLSERRATAVKDYLVESGVAASRLSTVGYGNTRPASHESTPSNKNSVAAKENMRVLFEVTVQ